MFKYIQSIAHLSFPPNTMRKRTATSNDVGLLFPLLTEKNTNTNTNTKKNEDKEGHECEKTRLGHPPYPILLSFSSSFV